MTAFSVVFVADAEVVLPLANSSLSGPAVSSLSSRLDLASKVEIKIEEVCLGKPGLIPNAFSSEPSIHVAPFVGRHFKKNTDINKGSPVVDAIRMDRQERLSDKESHAGHYVFKNLTVSVHLADILENLKNAPRFEAKTDAARGEESIQFYGLNLAVMSGVSPLVVSRWAFNGDESTQQNQTSSPLMKIDEKTGDFTKINTLWPSIAVLVNSSRRFVTINDSFFGVSNHKNYNEKPKCDQSPFIIYSVKKTPSK